ncbi:MAG: hypothetical protein ACYTFG_18915, partial [Planctomycetota bacterium]|jgi:hypothetical protein
VKGIEKGLKDALHRLGCGTLEQKERVTIRSEIEKIVEAIETACRESGSAPSGLPGRSARAYAMMKWLADRHHFDLYLHATEQAREILPSAARGGRFPDSMDVRFQPGNHIYQLTREESRHSWRLGLGYIEAGPADFMDLASVVRAGRGAARSARERYSDFVHSPDFHRIDRELEALTAGARQRSRGRTHDLDALFRSLNERFFAGDLEKPQLLWWTTWSRQLFGHYTEWFDRVTVNAMLDDPAVPRYVPEAVLYHELLHKKHGAVLEKGRRVWHTRAFRGEEARYPRLDEARRWLDALSRGERLGARMGRKASRRRQLMLPF